MDGDNYDNRLKVLAEKLRSRGINVVGYPIHGDNKKNTVSIYLDAKSNKFVYGQPIKNSTTTRFKQFNSIDSLERFVNTEILKEI